MKRAATGVLGALVVFWSVFAIAAADRKTVNDITGDAPIAGVDIYLASAKHGPNGKLIHRVSMDGPIPDDQDPYRISLQMSLDRDRDCELEFHVFEGTEPGDITLIKCGVGESQKEGKLKVIDDRTLQFTFEDKLLGKPDAYKWRMIVGECDPGCDETIDTVPDENVPEKQKYIKHVLRD